MELKFRRLRPEEIDCRVAQINEKGLSLLLYKDARCDMTLLDETVGPMNWMRSHSRENANCTVSIYDAERREWVSKEDTGTESNTEAAKGLASDSFKRACVNWGIGRELYTAPFIWVASGNYRQKEGRNGKPACADSFAVKHIRYTENGEISELEIINRRTGDAVYRLGDAGQPEHGAVLCAVCGKPIKPVKNGNEIISVADVVARSTKVYGKPVCLACASKISGSQS